MNDKPRMTIYPSETMGARMQTPIATYQLTVSGWNWEYNLYPERLTAIGKAKGENQRFEVEFRHCSSKIDRGVGEQNWVVPARVWVFGAIMFLSTIIFFGTANPLADFLFGAPHETRGPIIVVTTFVVEFVIFLLLIRFMKHIRVVQRTVIFKSNSTGVPLLILNSEQYARDDAFDEFISQVIEAIEKQHGETQHSSHAFRE
jgi:hypothetical protein